MKQHSELDVIDESPDILKDCKSLKFIKEKPGIHKTNLDHKPFFGKNLKPWQKNLYKICGILSFLMGMLGIALPLLPTTPFLLLAVWCYARSSEKLYYWLVYHRVFGEYIRNYRDKKGIPLRIKVGVLVLLWATISFSAFFAVEIIWVRILLMIIAIGVSIHILKIPTLKRKT